MSVKVDTSKDGLNALLNHILRDDENDTMPDPNSSTGARVKVKTYYHRQVKRLSAQDYNSIVSSLIKRLKEYQKTVQYWTNEINKAAAEDNNVSVTLSGKTHQLTRADISKMGNLFLSAISKSKYVFRSSKLSSKSTKSSGGSNSVLLMSGPFQIYTRLLIDKLVGTNIEQLEGLSESDYTEAIVALNYLKDGNVLASGGHVMKITANAMFYIGAYISNIEKTNERILAGTMPIVTKDDSAYLKLISEDELKAMKQKYEGGTFRATYEMRAAFANDPVGLSPTQTQIFNVYDNNLKACINTLLVASPGDKSKFKVVADTVWNPQTLFQKMSVDRDFNPEKIPTNLVNRMLSLLDFNVKNRNSYHPQILQTYDDAIKFNDAVKADSALLQKVADEAAYMTSLRKYYSHKFNKESDEVKTSKKVLTSAINAARKIAAQPPRADLNLQRDQSRAKIDEIRMRFNRR